MGKQSFILCFSYSVKDWHFKNISCLHQFKLYRFELFFVANFKNTNSFFFLLEVLLIFYISSCFSFCSVCFPRIFPLFSSYLICWHTIIHNILFYIFISFILVVITLFHCQFQHSVPSLSFYFYICLVNGLLVFLIFSFC